MPHARQPTLVRLISRAKQSERADLVLDPVGEVHRRLRPHHQLALLATSMLPTMQRAGASSAI